MDLITEIEMDDPYGTAVGIWKILYEAVDPQEVKSFEIEEVYAGDNSSVRVYRK